MAHSSIKLPGGNGVPKPYKEDAWLMRRLGKCNSEGDEEGKVSRLHPRPVAGMLYGSSRSGPNGGDWPDQEPTDANRHDRGYSDGDIASSIYQQLLVRLTAESDGKTLTILDVNKWVFRANTIFREEIRKEKGGDVSDDEVNVELLKIWRAAFVDGNNPRTQTCRCCTSDRVARTMDAGERGLVGAAVQDRVNEVAEEADGDDPVDELGWNTAVLEIVQRDIAAGVSEEVLRLRPVWFWMNLHREEDLDWEDVLLLLRHPACRELVPKLQLEKGCALIYTTSSHVIDLLRLIFFIWVSSFCLLSLRQYNSC